jgi:FkbM family methyltransferase
MNRQSTLASPPSSLTSGPVDQALVEAISHHHAGHAAEAEKLYRVILDSPSGNPVASYGFGLLCATQGRLREAANAYRQAIAMRPDFVDAYINLGTTVLALGQHEEAAALYRHAVMLNPENAMAHGNLGKALQDLGRIDEAIISYHAAIALEPDNAIINANFGAVLLERHAWDDAAAVTRRAIASQQDNALAYANLGTALMHLGRHDEALVACRQAIALRPTGVAMHANLGGAMLELGAPREAVALCHLAIGLDPLLPSAHFNLSHALMATNQLEEAALAARQAIALRPESAEYHFHLAHILLLRGDMEGGWVEYDWRWKLPDFAWISDLHGPFAQPVWTGEDISHKTILIYTEQGLGDIILFARYLPLVVRKAGQVILAVHPPIRRLLETIEGITIVSIRDVPLPDFDVRCPLLSLPRAFATTLDSIPEAVPYLRADAAGQAYWDRRIGGNAPRVGIVWAGNPATKRDRFRSPGLASVAPLFSIPGIDFIALQVGEERDANPLPPHVLDLGQEVTDLADTAAIMSGLDLVISSCTAPLHLAGALGVRTWAIIPFAPYFPWLLERTDTPWYPSVRLYRQAQPGRDWSDVVGRIAIDLAALAESRRATLTGDLSQRTPTEQPIVMSTPPTTDPNEGGCNELAPCRGGLMLYNRNDTYIGASLRKYGEFSGEETALFRLIVQPGRTVLDVGANIGAHTVDLARLVGSAGVLHAFEPQRLMFQLLCANVALNSCTNVFTHQAAVGAVNGTLFVPALDSDEPTNYGGLSLLVPRPGEPVPLVTIDSLDLRDCQFIKLDIEGMETEALRGATATIGRFRPILYVENDRQARSSELISLLQLYGYRLYWHLPPLFRADNFRGDTENIFGAKVSVNMIGIPAEIPQSSLTNLREVTGPTDSVIRWS